MTSKSQQLIENLSLSFEDAYEAVGIMTNVTQAELQGVTIYSGAHPTYGSIHVVVPAAGDGLLLPFALQQF